MILLTSTGRIDSYVQFITVLIIFLFVLAITYVVTRWIANFQKTQTIGKNIEVVETQRISSTKYIQIVKIAERYYAIAVCKDTVTMLAEVNGEEIKPCINEQNASLDFKSVWEKVKNSSHEKNGSDQEK